MNSTASRPKKSPSSKAKATNRKGAKTQRPRSSLRASESLRFKETLRPGIERDTPLMPEAIAESVCAEAGQFLDEEMPARYVAWLAAKAERCYSARHRHFYKLMRGSGNAPRDWLYVFMRHWLANLLGLERPDLYRCLPPEFGNGRKLPHGRHPRIHRQGFIPNLLPNARSWNAARVTRHFRWAWLASRKN